MSVRDGWQSQPQQLYVSMEDAVRSRLGRSTSDFAGLLRVAAMCVATLVAGRSAVVEVADSNTVQQRLLDLIVTVGGGCRVV